MSHMQRFQRLYADAASRNDFASMDNLDSAWDAAIDEAERSSEDGDYTDDDVAVMALRLLNKK
jgi:hypothetical protein